MKDNIWTYVFGIVGALAGIVYLYQASNAQQQAPVTNVFPPLNTDDGALAGQVEPTGDDSTQPNGVTMPTQTTKPYPIFLV
jgi:hypothetical protein